MYRSFFFFSSRRRHTRYWRDWSSDVCSSDLELDDILKKYGIRYFISESTSVLNASPRPKYGTYAPIVTPNGICVFGRYMESSRQVWSSFMGYPGDFNYREFYSDIGYEAPMEYIAPYINRSGIRIDTGVKYYKITGETENKLYYNRDRKSTRLNSSHANISYAVFCLKKKKNFLSKNIIHR